ncbi:MAG TPA: hypothetical protein VJ476_03585, partial [Rhizomicrobium sp.]|nr:hypothetical protein [Rhizomicrobium sp.]
MDARIKRIVAHVVNVPHTRNAAWSGGSTKGATRTIVEVETADGLAGLGEAPGADAANRIESRISASVTGLDCWDRNLVRQRCLGKVADFGGLYDPGSVNAYA